MGVALHGQQHAGAGPPRAVSINLCTHLCVGQQNIDVVPVGRSARTDSYYEVDAGTPPMLDTRPAKTHHTAASTCGSKGKIELQTQLHHETPHQASQLHN
jgi:hypothetical protein